ncbi:DUF4870 domain-containing protein [Paenibacillus paeoniae]|uniref:DUF4870 domain-containing protein n=1 Tax=Paenibacillus paeoniae TaxID=2292705 RepID=A0A371P1K8_9BACL|nr:DUF4870 domain-containing protein [Paenibacillus paeoniae]
MRLYFDEEGICVYDRNPVSRDDQTFGMLCHLLAFSTFIIPFGSIIGPLVIWLIKKDHSPYVNEQGKESLNFQISIMIYCIISSILIILFIGVLLLIAIGIAWFILVILASIKANEGSVYRYPVTIRFIK